MNHDQIVASASAFIKDTIYPSLDSISSQQSQQLLANLFSPSSKIIWNGNALDKNTYLATFPPTAHSIHSFDVQLVGGEVLILLVSGWVRYGAGDERVFSETFVLGGGCGGGWVVEGVCFRFV